LSLTDPMKTDSLIDEDVSAFPEFHAKKMHVMPEGGKPHGKFPDTLFYTTFYVGVDSIIDECDLHPADLDVIVVLIEEHHTLEYGEKKDLYPGYDQDKGYDGGRYLREKTKTHRYPVYEDVKSEENPAKQ
jgi:hypothetical protein